MLSAAHLYHNVRHFQVRFVYRVEDFAADTTVQRWTCHETLHVFGLISVGGIIANSGILARFDIER